MSTKEKKKKLTLKNFTGSAPSSVNKTPSQKTSTILEKKLILDKENVTTNTIEKKLGTDDIKKIVPGTIVSEPEKPRSTKEWAKKKIQEENNLAADNASLKIVKKKQFIDNRKSVNNKKQTKCINERRFRMVKQYKT